MIKHLYIHVPFCKTICSYCDFAHMVYKENVVDKWLERVSYDLSLIKDEEYETIYIGGGTPSCLNIEQLNRLLSLVKPFSNKVIEYTIEINVETVDIDKIKLFKQFGINRVSIGLQTSDDRLLKLLNRHHSFLDVKNAVDLLNDNGIYNISIDVMYSLPSQAMEDLKKTINDVLSLNVPHVSLYSLTIEEGTLFDKLGYKPLDEDTEADMYEYIEKTLKSNGYIHYEIANFAKEGYESKHNLGYWKYDDYRGISAGSVGKYKHCRYIETKDVYKYINSKNSETVEDIDLKDEAFENIMMSLRTIYGLDMNDFKEKYGLNFMETYKEAINKNRANLAFKEGKCICINRAILNTILLDFMY